jgi:hypothetical protein
MKFRFLGIVYIIGLYVPKGEKGLIETKHAVQLGLAGLQLEGLIDEYRFGSWPKGRDFSLMVRCGIKKSETTKERLINLFKKNNIEIEEVKF